MSNRTGNPWIKVGLSLGLLGCAIALSAPSGSSEMGAVTVRPEASDAGVRRDPGPGVSGQTDPLLTLIVTWLSKNFDLPANYDHPHVARVSGERIAALRFGTANLSGHHEVVAVYHDKRRTIYLPEHWTGRTPAELSVLVHEMVHHLQNLDGQTFPSCPGARERLAYDAQEKWLGLFGLTLMSEFNVDPFTVKASTLCG